MPAMLSNTFQTVYDNARDVAAMQRAEMILSIENSVSAAAVQKYREEVLQGSLPLLIHS